MGLVERATRLLGESVPRVTMPKLKRLTTRPDQQVQHVDTDRQKRIADKKLGGSGDADADRFDNAGQSGKGTGAGWEKSGTRGTREHEGLHVLLDLVRQEYGKYARDKVLQRLHRKVPGRLSYLLRKYLRDRKGYDDYVNEEILAWHYSLLTQARSRDKFRKWLTKQFTSALNNGRLGDAAGDDPTAQALEWVVEQSPMSLDELLEWYNEGSPGNGVVLTYDVRDAVMDDLFDRGFMSAMKRGWKQIVRAAERIGPEDIEHP